MAISSVFTGADGSLTLSAPDGPEGESANDVMTAYDMISVGRVHDVKVKVHSDVKAFHEIGQRYATELRPGNVTIRGSIGRAQINGAMLRLLLGEAAGGRPGGSWTQPAFNITLFLASDAVPGTRNTVTLHDCKIDDWASTVPEDDFVMERVNFQALFMTTEDDQ